MAFRSPLPGANTGGETGGLRPPPLRRGRITNVRTRYAREFMFNPTEIDSSEEWQYGEHGVPGSSHKIYHGGHGGSRSIKLTLFLDAERGRSNVRHHGAAGDVEGGQLATISRVSKDQELDLTEEINFYNAFTYPSRARDSSSLADHMPARAVLTLGPLFPGVEMLVRRVDVKVVQWTPQLAPMKATVSLDMERYAQRPIVSNSIFQDPFTAGEE